MSKNLSQLARRKGLGGLLFDDLGQVIDRKGVITEDDLQEMADRHLVGTANVYATASSYDFLGVNRQKKKAYVCNGSACMLAGAQSELTSALEQKLGQGEVGEMCCLGRCYENGAFHYEDDNYSYRDIADLDEIINQKQGSPVDDYRVHTSGTAVLTADLPDTHFIQILKTQFKRSPEELLNEIRTSELRGRGGAGFPIAIKLDTVRNQNSEEKYIVCNADEGDPGAFSDRYLLERQTYSVLTGMILTGYITGAKEGVVYLRAEYPDAIRITRKAIDELNAMFPFVREDGSGIEFELYLVPAHGAYICGEETALLNSIEGQRPEVRTRPPFPAIEGLFGQPTLINNVETLACIPYILDRGGAQYASLGTDRSKGTKLLSLDGFFNRPGLYEVPMGTSLSEVVYEMAGGFRQEIKAIQVGGPLGGIVPMEKIPELTLDFESFKEAGFLLGHASIVCIPKSFPMIRYMEHLFSFTAHESCGKCFPCRIGAKRGAEMLEKAQTESFKIDRALMNDLLETLQLGSLCGLGGGIPLPIQNILNYFEEELHTYFIH